MSGTCKSKVIIALGHFDSVHIGHRAVIGKAVEEAKSTAIVPAVFMFDGDLKSCFISGAKPPVYTTKTRRNLISKLGVDEFFIAPISSEFLSLEKREFLDKLNEKYDIIGYVSGFDYRFGKNASGDVEFLSEYAKEKSQKVFVVGDKRVKDVRVSTTHIKELLSDGKISLANVMLGENYSVSGKVIDGRKVGRKLGIPTINLAVDKTCLFLKDGVYSGRTEIDGKEFKLVINYGGRPTFNLDEKLIEAHIIDYSGDLYGKEVKIEFLSYIRGLYAFRDQDQLKEQIKKDIERVNTDD